MGRPVFLRLADAADRTTLVSTEVADALVLATYEFPAGPPGPVTGVRFSDVRLAEPVVPVPGRHGTLSRPAAGESWQADLVGGEADAVEVLDAVLHLTVTVGARRPVVRARRARAHPVRALRARRRRGARRRHPRQPAGRRGVARAAPP